MGEIPEGDLKLSPLVLESQFVDSRILAGLDLYGSNAGLIDPETAANLHVSSTRPIDSIEGCGEDPTPPVENPSIAPEEEALSRGTRVVGSNAPSSCSRTLQLRVATRRLQRNLVEAMRRKLARLWKKRVPLQLPVNRVSGLRSSPPSTTVKAIEITSFSCMLFPLSPGGRVLSFKLWPFEAFILLSFLLNFQLFDFESYRLVVFIIFLSNRRLCLGLRYILILDKSFVSILYTSIKCMITQDLK